MAICIEKSSTSARHSSELDALILKILEKINLSPTNKNDIESIIDAVLEELSFSKDDLGTVYYKEVLKAILIFLQTPYKGRELEELKTGLLNPYSFFYFDIAKEIDFDLGLKSFHSQIDIAIINARQKNRKLTNFNYMYHAYLLAEKIYMIMEKKLDINQTFKHFKFSKAKNIKKPTT